MLKTVLFDMGNTLIDYHAGPSSDDDKDRMGLEAMVVRLASWGRVVSYEALLNRFYLPWLSLFGKRKNSVREFDLIDALEPAIPFIREFSDEQVKNLVLDFHEPSAREAVTDEGTLEALDLLKTLSVRTVMISNSAIPGYCHDRTLELLGMLNRLDLRLYSYDAGIRKPHAEIFLSAMRSAGSSPNESAMVGDSWELDICPAMQLGMTVVPYQSLRSKKESPFDRTPARTILEAVQILTGLTPPPRSR